MTLRRRTLYKDILASLNKTAGAENIDWKKAFYDAMDAFLAACTLSEKMGDHRIDTMVLRKIVCDMKEVVKKGGRA